jgi:hypothetical protein
MQYELFISPAALSETLDAYEFYETTSIGLGDRFLKSLEDTYKRITYLPKSYSFISNKKDLRDVKIIDVTFQIFDNKIIVLRVFNTNRKPLTKF